MIGRFSSSGFPHSFLLAFTAATSSRSKGISSLLSVLTSPPVIPRARQLTSTFHASAKNLAACLGSAGPFDPSQPTPCTRESPMNRIRRPLARSLQHSSSPSFVTTRPSLSWFMRMVRRFNACRPFLTGLANTHSPSPGSNNDLHIPCTLSLAPYTLSETSCTFSDTFSDAASTSTRPCTCSSSALARYTSTPRCGPAGSGGDL
mmetsp:Transcript_10574/g.32368  ORF Transcript_10574/g.32368 Transcript_10574/m.32368 type:complete len:204 (-) Transcript_10574:74-685(-)